MEVQTKFIGLNTKQMMIIPESESESALLAKYVNPHEEFDSCCKLVSMSHKVLRITLRKIRQVKHRTYMYRG